MKKALLIPAWYRIHEGSQTIKIKNLEWFKMPVSRKSVGIQRLSRSANGLELLGSYTLMAEVAAEGLVHGLLAIGDRGMTAAEIVSGTNFSAKTLQRAIDFLLTPEIGWLVWVEPHFTWKAEDAPQKLVGAGYVEHAKKYVGHPMFKTLFNQTTIKQQSNADPTTFQNQSNGNQTPFQLEEMEVEERRNKTLPPSPDSTPDAGKNAPPDPAAKAAKLARQGLAPDGSPLPRRKPTEAEGMTPTKKRQSVFMLRWNPAMTPLYAPDGTSQGDADRTSAKNLFFETVWPDGMGIEEGERQAGQAITLAQKAVGKQTPMAWLTKSLQNAVAMAGGAD